MAMILAVKFIINHTCPHNSGYPTLPPTGSENHQHHDKHFSYSLIILLIMLDF